MCVQITEDFIAAYQANYGFGEDGASAATEEPQPEKPKDEKEKVAKEEKQEEDVTESGTAKEEKKKGEKRKAEPGVHAHISFFLSFTLNAIFNKNQNCVFKLV